ncbi:hypothetical protein SUGI_0180250 [Cryptomeria japonica]|nr:hypothetical protein SUGI_0180250 [Cryptomeria japonica]
MDAGDMTSNGVEVTISAWFKLDRWEGGCRKVLKGSCESSRTVLTWLVSHNLESTRRGREFSSITVIRV